jgi:hypothetical protein
MPPEPRVVRMDLAKWCLLLVGLEDAGPVVVRKPLTRDALMPMMTQLPPVIIGWKGMGAPVMGHGVAVHKDRRRSGARPSWCNPTCPRIPMIQVMPKRGVTP